MSKFVKRVAVVVVLWLGTIVVAPGMAHAGEGIWPQPEAIVAADAQSVHPGVILTPCGEGIWP